MERDWARYGEAVARERAARGLKQTELAEAVGVKRATVQNIEAGKPYAKVALSHRAIARFYGWTDDSPERVLAGGDPEPAQQQPSATTPAPAAPVPEAPDAAGRLPRGLSERARVSLEHGRIVESDVIDDPDDPDGGIVINLVARPDRPLTRRDFQRWAAIQRIAREIYSKPDDET